MALVQFINKAVREYELQHNSRLKELWVNDTLIDAYIDYVRKLEDAGTLGPVRMTEPYVNGKLLVYKPDDEAYFMLQYLEGTEVFASVFPERCQGMEY